MKVRKAVVRNKIAPSVSKIRAFYRRKGEFSKNSSSSNIKDKIMWYITGTVTHPLFNPFVMWFSKLLPINLFQKLIKQTCLFK